MYYVVRIYQFTTPLVLQQFQSLENAHAYAAALASEDPDHSYAIVTIAEMIKRSKA
jgi:hypothetical protein